MKKLLALFILTVFLASCNSPSYSTLFSVKRTDYGYIVKIKDNGKVRTYYLSRHPRKGQIKIPVSRVIVLSSTHIGFISDLGQVDKIIGVSGKKYIYSPILRKHLNSITEVGFENSLNLEKILSLHPDVIFTYSLNNTDEKKIALMEKAGITVVPVYEYLENAPLARAKWLEVFGAFFDKYDTARTIFNNIERRYNREKVYVKKFISRLNHKTKVLANIPYRGVWYVPSGKSYMAQLIMDAGGDYPWANTTSQMSIPLDFETVFTMASDADVLINPNTATSLQQVIATDKRLKRIRAIRLGKVYNFTKKMSPGGGFAFWENGVVEPDKILHDLIAIFYPNSIFAKDSLYYYKKLN